MSGKVVLFFALILAWYMFIGKSKRLISKNNSPISLIYVTVFNFFRMVVNMVAIIGLLALFIFCFF